MRLQAVHADFESMAGVRGSGNDDDITGALDSMPPEFFDDDDAVERLTHAVQSIVTGAAVGSPSPDDYAAAVDTIYHAFGQWSENGDLEVMAEAIAASASQLAEIAPPEAARAVAWGRGSPLLAAGLETGARFAYLTPQELVACQGAVAQARSRVVDGPAGEVTSTVLRWILEAASHEGHGLFVELWP